MRLFHLQYTSSTYSIPLQMRFFHLQYISSPYSAGFFLPTVNLFYLQATTVHLLDAALASCSLLAVTFTIHFSRCGFFTRSTLLQMWRFHLQYNSPDAAFSSEHLRRDTNHVTPRRPTLGSKPELRLLVFDLFFFLIFRVFHIRLFSSTADMTHCVFVFLSGR